MCKSSQDNKRFSFGSIMEHSLTVIAIGISAWAVCSSNATSEKIASDSNKISEKIAGNSDDLAKKLSKLEGLRELDDKVNDYKVEVNKSLYSIKDDIEKNLNKEIYNSDEITRLNNSITKNSRAIRTQLDILYVSLGYDIKTQKFNNQYLFSKEENIKYGSIVKEAEKLKTLNNTISSNVNFSTNLMKKKTKTNYYLADFKKEPFDNYTYYDLITFNIDEYFYNPLKYEAQFSKPGLNPHHLDY
ncbi:hypothetical protein ACMGE5_03315 [Macrococcus equi]|uniref:hypothetical protein n=1 Tax=Macrococcus equi TaxID=3395462 RepID=UPI0039BE0DB8